MTPTTHQLAQEAAEQIVALSQTTAILYPDDMRKASTAIILTALQAQDAEREKELPLVLGHPATAEWCRAVDEHHGITEQQAKEGERLRAELMDAKEALSNLPNGKDVLAMQAQLETYERWHRPGEADEIETVKQIARHWENENCQSAYETLRAHYERKAGVYQNALYAALLVDLANKELTALRQQLDERTEERNRASGAFNTLANCNDTLRSRGFMDGATDDRVIAMAQELDALKSSLATAEKERDEARAEVGHLANESVSYNEVINTLRSRLTAADELAKALGRTTSYIEAQEFTAGLKSEAAESARAVLAKWHALNGEPAPTTKDKSP
jgi:hypothetical protein